MAGFDPSIIGGNPSLVSKQRLQQEFEVKKQLAMVQAAQAIKQLQSPEIGQLDLLKLQMGQQEHQDSLDIRREGLAQQRQLAEMNIGVKQDARQEKLDLKKANDQNSLDGLLAASNEQLALIKSIKEDPGTAKNFGFYNYIPNRKGGEAANAEASLNRLDANTFIGGLQKLKSQSATGATGIGGASDTEGAKVQAAQAALQRSQDYPSFLKNLEVYEKSLTDANQRLIGNFNNVYNRQQSGTDSGGLKVNITLDDLLAEKARRGK